MRVLTVLNYYLPYISGMTVYAQRVAEALAKNGHDVSLVCSHHDTSLPREENMNGVRVSRAKVDVTIGKGVLSREFVQLVLQQARHADVVHMHSPMLEAGALALALKLMKKPVVLTYQCDVALDGGIGWFISKAMDASSHLAMANAGAVCALTNDYAESSRVLKHHLRRLQVVPPPVPPLPAAKVNNRFARAAGEKRIGFLGRFVEEKGIGTLLDAFARVDVPNATLWLGGEHEKVAGGSVMNDLQSRIEALGARVKVLGRLGDDELRPFFESLDVLALPSVNSFEAFGLVQVEAMSCGTPVVASSLPGVRMVVRETGMGRIVEPRDVNGLAQALTEVLAEKPALSPGALDKYAPERVAATFEQMYRSLVA